MTDTAHAGTPHEDRIPVDLDQPIVLAVHNPNGDVTVRAADRSDVLIRHVTPGLSEDLGVGDVELMIDVHNNRIEVRANPGVGVAGSAAPPASISTPSLGKSPAHFSKPDPGPPPRRARSMLLPVATPGVTSPLRFRGRAAAGSRFALPLAMFESRASAVSSRSTRRQVTSGWSALRGIS